jgi:fructokinase
VQKSWNEIRGIHVGSIPIVSAQSSGELIELIREVPEDVLVSFDPNVRLSVEPDVELWVDKVEEFRRHAHFIKVSEEDLANLYGSAVDENSIAQQWLSNRCSLVALTRGERGSTYYSRSEGRIDIPAEAAVVLDTVGAGDSFQAASLAWLAENQQAVPARLSALSRRALEDLGRFAANAAAATCSQRGPEFPYRAALRKSD